MSKSVIRTNALFTILLLVACGTNASNNQNESTPSNTSQSQTAVVSVDSIPSERTSIKKEAVASYSKKTDDPLNDFYFSVKLYETKYTQRFLMKLTYETLQVSDTISIPYLNIWPNVKIEKGASGLECIVGFLDQQQQFRPYKKVFVENEKLRVKTLHFYRVRGWKKELY